MSELVQFIKDNPSVLKRPIMVDTNRIQVGYNSEEIMTFIPRERRAQMEAELMMGVRQQNEDTEICLDDDCPTK